MLNSQDENLEWGLIQKTWQVGQREGRVRFKRIPQVIDWEWVQIRRVVNIECMDLCRKKMDIRR